MCSCLKTPHIVLKYNKDQQIKYQFKTNGQVVLRYHKIGIDVPKALGTRK